MLRGVARRDKAVHRPSSMRLAWRESALAINVGYGASMAQKKDFNLPRPLVLKLWKYLFIYCKHTNNAWTLNHKTAATTNAYSSL
jgi:hypothetical protein